jgi:hypothetical protein
MKKPPKPLPFSEFCPNEEHRVPDHLLEAWIRTWQLIETLSETMPSCVWAWALATSVIQIDEVLSELDEDEKIDFESIKEQGPVYVVHALLDLPNGDKSDESDGPGRKPVNPTIYRRLMGDGGSN